MTKDGYEYIIKKAEENGLKETLDVFLEIVQTYEECEKVVREARKFSTRSEISSSANSYI